jgi:hypothetical protein
MSVEKLDIARRQKRFEALFHGLLAVKGGDDAGILVKHIEQLDRAQVVMRQIIAHSEQKEWIE